MLPPSLAYAWQVSIYPARQAGMDGHQYAGKHAHLGLIIGFNNFRGWSLCCWVFPFYSFAVLGFGLTLAQPSPDGMPATPAVQHPWEQAGQGEAGGQAHACCLFDPKRHASVKLQASNFELHEWEVAGFGFPMLNLTPCSAACRADPCIIKMPDLRFSSRVSAHLLLLQQLQPLLFFCLRHTDEHVQPAAPGGWQSAAAPRIALGAPAGGAPEAASPQADCM